MKLKIVLCLFFFLTSSPLFSQSGYKVLYDRLGLHLYFRYDYYNSVKINEDVYDQYKVTGYAEYDGSKPIFTPINFKFSFQKHTNEIETRYYTPKMKGNEPYYIPINKLIKKLPNSRIDIDFTLIQKGQQLHKFWGLGSLATDKLIDTAAIPNCVNNILLPGYKSESTIYILVDKGKELPIPTWEVSDLRHQFVYVEPYWEKNNLAEEPFTFNNSFTSLPIGKMYDVPTMNKVNLNEVDILTEEKNENKYGTIIQKSIEDLKRLILENLRQNTSEIKATFSDQYSTETIKYSNQKFNFDGENFEVQFQFVATKKLKSIDYFERMTPKKVVTKIPIYDLKGVFNYKENKAYPKQLIFLNKEGKSTNGKYIFTDAYNNDHVIEAGEMQEPQSFYYGYNFGKNNENFIVLKNLISALHKQIQIVSPKN